jgi:hypothetical protein
VSCFSGRGLIELAWFAGVTCFRGEACAFDLSGFEEPCFEEPCFEEPWNIFDSQPASLAPIGSSTNATAATMITANFLPDGGNSCFPDFLSAPHDRLPT